MVSQKELGERFAKQHDGSEVFVIANPWDVGSARLMEQAGFKALATTSAGYAYSRGRPDGGVGREDMLLHMADIAHATSLPVSGDLENGYGDAPSFVADTIRLAAEAGLVGGSIEDVTGAAHDPVYDIGLASERIAAAAEVARALPFRFTLTARADNYLAGRPELGDTIRRLQAYQEAGADVLFAPGLRKLDDIATLVRSVDRPVNVIMGLAGVDYSVAELAAVGVKRISLGASVSRHALAAVQASLQEIITSGTFTYANEAVTSAEANRMFSR